MVAEIGVTGARAAGGGSILVVEDDPVLRDMLRWLLEDEGFPVEEAADARQALRLLAAGRYAAVLLDWNLPDADGSDVADGLRALHGDRIPVILVSALPLWALGPRAELIGAAAWFAKPFSADELLTAVRALAVPG